MTGGGTGGCLQSLEAKGLGEGWSDAVAEYVPILLEWNQFNDQLNKLGIPDLRTYTSLLGWCLGDGEHRPVVSEFHEVLER